MKQSVRFKIISIFAVCIFMVTIVATISKSGVLPINSYESEAVEDYRQDAENEIKYNTIIVRSAQLSV